LELMKLELKWIKFTKNYLPFNFLLWYISYNFWQLMQLKMVILM
jgi:hypothetical protein